MVTARFVGKLAGRVVSNVVFYGLPLFLPAWRLGWWRAWVLLGVVAATTAATMLSVYPHRPDLLDERSKAPVQTGQPAADKVLLLALFLSFLGLLVFVPLDVFHLRALGLTELPVAAVGLVLFVLGATVITLAMRENAFAAPVVRHQEERGQVVVSTGPYGIVRHPMYAGALPSTIGMALWLGSYAAAVAAAIPITLLVLRVLAEERLLRRELAGYDAYTQKVRWRLVPFVW